ncbi:MAG: methylmalonyl Co-A mutase-associated GTPase MeaB [Rhodospirillales bacterium]|nr:methylmalonyl Co-A mutase-associated GTPase MeaB [Rhodospirillales bacterium]
MAAAATLDGLVRRLAAGEVAALARCLTLAEDERHAAALLRRIHTLTGRASVIGFTGAPGVGKSSLIDAYIGELRRRGQTVAVAAIDPSSPLTGGAVLGDRVRMHRHVADGGVFIRSIASRGHPGGLSESIHRTIDVMDASGRDVIIIETVGTGQSEVEVADIADISVVVCAPGLGDDVQAIKAGILEIADVLVVNKADLPHADQTVRQLRNMLRLRRQAFQDVPVVATSATEGRGLDELRQAVARLDAGTAAGRIERRVRRMRRLIAQKAAGIVRGLILDLPAADMAALAAAAGAGEIDLAAAAMQALATVTPRRG